MNRTNTIYLKLFVPFAALLLLASVIAWLITTTLFTSMLKHRQQAQLAHATKILAQGHIPYTKALLVRLGKLIKADILLIRKNGKPGTMTLATHDPGLNEILAIISHVNSINSTQTRYLTINKNPIQIVISPITSSHARESFKAVAAIASLEDAYRTSEKVAAWMALAAFAGILIFAVIGHRVVKKITRQIRQLVDMTKMIAEGDRRIRASDIGTIEIRELAHNLNHMASQLETYENTIKENSRLSAIGQTAARIAHEIRNPLTAIKMNIELLHETAEGDTKESTAKLLAEIRRLESIVTSTMNTTKIAKPNKIPTDINTLLLDILDLFRAQLEHRNIVLNTNLQAYLPMINVDSDQIKQVVVNILLNANDALPSGGTIAITTSEKKENILNISIADSGPGIDDTIAESLFTAKLTNKASGFGLGLNICKELIALHGGTIRVTRSRLGGADFIISLPVEK